MSIQCVVINSLFLLLLCATMAIGTRAQSQPISDYNNEQVQFLGKYAVDEYNKKGESHLVFISVVNGTVYPLQINSAKIWYLQLKATNCSEPGSGEGSLYFAQLFENFGFRFDFKNALKAYNSEFISFGITYKFN